MNPNIQITPHLQTEIDTIVHQFSQHERRNEIKQAVMVRHHCTWDEAEELVQYVEQYHQKQVQIRQFPVRITQSCVFMIAGLLFSCLALFFVVGQYQEYLLSYRIFGPDVSFWPYLFGPVLKIVGCLLVLWLFWRVFIGKR